MAISFKEKRALQKIVAGKMEDLKGGSLSFKEKRVAQKELKAAFEKLDVKIDQAEGDSTQNAKLKALLAGEYNDKPHTEFIVILDEIVAEIEGLEATKPGIIGYCEANQDKMKKAA